MEGLKFDELLRAGEPGALSIAAACQRLQKLLSTELSTPLHLHSMESRRKFFAFLPRFLDRVFGEDQEKQSKVSAWMTQSYDALHDPQPTTSSGPKSPTNAAVTGPYAHLGENGQALVQLFEKALYEFVFNIPHAVRFRLDVACIPNPAQVEIRNTGNIPPSQAKLYSTSSISMNGKNQCLMVPIQTYFLFSLLRYPVSTSKLKRPIATTSTSQSSSSNSAPQTAKNWWRSFPVDGIKTLTDQNPYNVLLLYYLKTFLPHGPEKLNFKSSQKQTMELFLNLLVELWMHQNQVVYDPTNTPLAAVKVLDQYTPPTDDVLSALLLTLVHILSDSHIPLLMHPSSHVVLKAIQKPLYDFLQIGFARATPASNPTSFYMLADTLLAYLQPWQCVSWNTGEAPTATFSSSYTAFVLANYHFYTTLFGHFITHSRDLEWDERSLDMLERALAIYSPELIATLDRAYSALDNSSGLTPPESNILMRHLSEFGLLATGVSLGQDFRRNAEHLLDKMQYMKDLLPHRRSSSNFLPAVFSAAGASSSTESIEARIQTLSQRLREVFNIPSTYVPVSVITTTPLKSFSLASLDPTRIAPFNILLSSEGRQQVTAGYRLCSTDSVTYIGDPMLKPISSYEIPFLVRFLYRVSMALNTLFGFENPYEGKQTLEDKVAVPDTFRINLRWLAAKGNFLWVMILILGTYFFLW